jgi:hypothetical protein
MITGLSEGSTELRSGDLDQENRSGGDDDDDDGSAGRMEGTGGTGGTGGSSGVGDVLLRPESKVRLEPMDGVRAGDVEVRGALNVGEDGRVNSLPTPTYASGAGGGSGRRLGVRMRTLREGLDADVCLDVLPDGVGEGAGVGVVRVGESAGGGGDGEACLGGGIDSVDLHASGSSSSSNNGRSTLSLCRTGPAPTGTASGTRKGTDGEVEFGDSR